MSDYSDLLARICDLETKLGELEFRLKALEEKITTDASAGSPIWVMDHTPYGAPNPPASS